MILKKFEDYSKLKWGGRESEKERESQHKFNVCVFRKWSISLTLIVTYGEVSRFSAWHTESIEQLREDCEAFHYVALAKSIQIHFSGSLLLLLLKQMKTKKSEVRWVLVIIIINNVKLDINNNAKKQLYRSLLEKYACNP